MEDSAGAVVEDLSAITISPSYAASDNLLFVFEFRMDEDDISGFDANSYVAEALLTF